MIVAENVRKEYVILESSDFDSDSDSDWPEEKLKKVIDSKENVKENLKDSDSEQMRMKIMDVKESEKKSQRF